MSGPRTTPASGRSASDGKALGAISAPSTIANVYFADGALWVAADVAGTVLRINPRTPTRPGDTTSAIC